MPLFTNPAPFRLANSDAMSQALSTDSMSRSGSSQWFWAQSESASSMSSQSLPPPPHSSHPALPHLIMLVFEAVLEVVCVSLPGYIIARQGMFTVEMQKFTANLNVALFTPCLIFNKLASQLSADKLVDLAIIPVIFVVQTLLSYLSSLAVSKLLGFSKRPRNFVIAMGVFGNSNSLPISLVLSLSHTIQGLHWDKKVGDNDKEVAARGILYLLIFQQLGQLVRWSWGYNVLLAPPDKFEGTDEHTSSRLENGDSGRVEEREALMDHSIASERDDQDGSRSDATRVGTGMAGLGSDGSPGTGPSLYSGDETPITHETQVFASSKSSPNIDIPKRLQDSDIMANPMNSILGLGTGASHPTGNSSPDQETRAVLSWLRRIPGRAKAASLRSTKRSKIWLAESSKSVFEALPRSLQKALAMTSHGIAIFVRGIWEFMNPPLWAMLAAIVVASIPTLQHIFFDQGTFLENSVTSAIRQSGDVAVPLILVVLGGNLARNTIPNERGNKSEEKEETKLLIAALVSRMVLPLLIMAPLLAVTAKFVKVSILGDPIFVIVCFLITGAPSALQLAQICQINNVYMGTMSRLLFQSYVVWILPSTLVLVMCALEVVEWAQR